MLVLSRKVNESLILTVGKKQIVIYLVKTEGDSAKLGINAPEDVKVYRKELWDDIMRNNFEAMRPTQNPICLPKLSVVSRNCSQPTVLKTKPVLGSTKEETRVNGTCARKAKKI